MTYQKFIHQTIEAVASDFPENTDFITEKIQKNNGVTLQALIIKTPETNIYPTLYMDEFYNRAKNGECIDIISEDILKLYNHCKVESPVDTSCLSDFSKIKKRLTVRLINREKNEGLLSDVPWEPFLDLAVVPAIHFDTPEGIYAESIIHNHHLKEWDITPEKLMCYARDNTPKILPGFLESIPEYLNDIAGEVVIPESNGDNCLYVLTNSERTNGAACLLYPDILKDFAEKHKSNVFIIPSSVHEVMFLKEDADSSMDNLSALIREVNETQVSEVEFLSDHAYLYNRCTGEIEY